MLSLRCGSIRAGRMHTKADRPEKNRHRTATLTMFVTAATTATTIVLGVAAFNATLLSNMVASYESSKSTTAAQAEVSGRPRKQRACCGS